LALGTIYRKTQLFDVTWHKPRVALGPCVDPSVARAYVALAWRARRIDRSPATTLRTTSSKYQEFINNDPVYRHRLIALYAVGHAVRLCGDGWRSDTIPCKRLRKRSNVCRIDPIRSRHVIHLSAGVLARRRALDVLRV